MKKVFLLLTVVCLAMTTAFGQSKGNLDLHITTEHTGGQEYMIFYTLKYPDGTRAFTHNIINSYKKNCTLSLPDKGYPKSSIKEEITVTITRIGKTFQILPNVISGSVPHSYPASFEDSTEWMRYENTIHIFYMGNVDER